MNGPRSRILVVAPHPDDEVFGCGGFLLSQRDKADIRIVLGTNLGATDDGYHVVANRLGATVTVADKERDCRLAERNIRHLVSFLETEIDTFRPDLLLFNLPSQHQDHKFVHDAVLCALRDRRDSHVVPYVARFEYQCLSPWQPLPNDGLWYHDIAETIEGKVQLFYDAYGYKEAARPSQINGEGILALARARGRECGLLAAEKFYLLRRITK